MTSVDRYSHMASGRRARNRGRRRTISQTYSAVPESVPPARHRIVSFAATAGADLEQLDSIRLAVSEALSNVVQHAYPDQPGTFNVAAWVVERELWILIADDGCGLNGDRESEGLGLGLALISQVSDGFVVMERGSGGTEVRMRFDLGDHPDAFGHDGSAARVRFLR
jgi:anti-sigma regulatory factor (Ser/Thr protein kinase)